MKDPELVYNTLCQFVDCLNNEGVDNILDELKALFEDDYKSIVKAISRNELAKQIVPALLKKRM